jgi:hypothetical protein
MDIEIKMSHQSDTGEAHLEVIVRGVLNFAAMKQVLSRIAEVLQPLPGCDTLVDLRQAACRLEPADIYALVHELRPDLFSASNRIAFVSPPDIEQYDQLYMLSAGFWSRGAKIEVFYGLDQAEHWLAPRSAHPLHA